MHISKPNVQALKHPATHSSESKNVSHNGSIIALAELIGEGRP